MRTICRLASFEPKPNVSLYLYSDDTLITILPDCVLIGDPEDPSLVIADCNQSNCVLYDGVSDPGDWAGWKYTYTPETDWVLI